MRPLRLLDAYRRPDLERASGREGNDLGGIFCVPSPTGGQLLRVIASNDGGWDHVSVSLPNRCPNWPEMEHIKRLFFKDEETAMQLHVPTTDHINIHPHCLHVWRPHDEAIPLPPKEFV